MKMDISNVIIGKRVFFRKCVCMMFVAAVIITYMFSVDCNIVKADEWDDAVKYYSNYGNAAVFKATNKMNGNIYFCSAGNTSTSGTKYRTIGYKMTIKGTGGNEIQKIYFQLGGQYLTLLNSKKQSGKEYMLYVITLQNIKTRFNEQALNALSSGSCTIVLDACMVLRVNGKNKGGMNDNGPSWGKVYTTYAGISKAANWTDSALTALYSYYGKTVRGLFHTIDVRKSTGISSAWADEINDNDNSIVMFKQQIGSRPRLIICGGGHVSAALVRMASLLAFDIWVIEDRPLFADNAKRQGADYVICGDYKNTLARMEPQADDYYVCMTRGHRFDMECLTEIFRKPYAYVGMMGSKKRAAIVKKDLEESGFSQENISGLHSPIGLAIGGQTPEEIALSVISEIVKCKNERTGCTQVDNEVLDALIEASDEKYILCTIIKKNGSASA